MADAAPTLSTVQWLGDGPKEPTDLTATFASDARDALHASQALSKALECSESTNAIHYFEYLDKDKKKEAYNELQVPLLQSYYIDAQHVYTSLFNKYGTHFINQLYLGGKATFVKTMKNNQTTKVCSPTAVHGFG